MSKSDLGIVKAKKEERIRNWTERKIKLAHKWIENEDVQKARPMIQGAIHLCMLGENVGNEQGGERPVLVISNNRVNSSSGNVKVIPLTTKLKTKTVKRKGAERIVPKVATHYFLKKAKYNFLDKDSAAKVEETTTVSKVRLTAYLGNIDESDLPAIKSRLKWLFDL
ncbi:type II toxin-antitoxin system PemK/MazF family toxin [Halalkalibacter oceani]|uniref:type II toxin-antitoxin system PemK/MazF family toxin n=1 Tax=Halalkalibacter oceani TaxID=1653776 RepID=UPI00339B4FFD